MSHTPGGQRLARLPTDEIGGLIAPMTRSLTSAYQKRLRVLLARLLD